MKRTWGVTIFAAAVFVPTIALGCGACIEDKVAATYDHAIVTAAAARGQVVVFGQIDSPAGAAAIAARIAAVASKVRGVRAATIRTSSQPPAFSFALDPARQTPEAAVADLERRVNSPGAALTVLRVMRGSAMVSVR